MSRGSRYDRAADSWRCGRSGNPCTRGPSSDGRCGGTTKCAPRNSDGRWHCTRPAHLGGPCRNGPTPEGKCGRRLPPCLPRPALRRLRGRLVSGSLALALALFLLLIEREHWQGWISAGELSSPHALLEHQCDACHTAGGQHWSHWIGMAINGDARHDTLRCLDCHSVGERPLLAHGDSRAEQHPEAMPEGTDVDTELACFICHSEHQGRESPVSSVPDRICGQCHTAFDGFAGHPAMQLATRPQAVQFDHLSHLNKHFEEEQLREIAPFDCRDCHATDRGGLYGVVPFAACASCHETQIWGDARAGPMGLALLEIPALDAGALRAAGLTPGSWPEDAEANLEGLLRGLLVSDPQVAADLARVEGLDWLDAGSANTSQQQALNRLAWKIKELLLDLHLRGQDALFDRLRLMLSEQDTASGAPPLKRTQAAALINGLSPELIDRWVLDAFPLLAEEVQAHRLGLPLPGDEASEPDPIGTPSPTASPTNGPTDQDDALLIDDELLSGDELLVGADPIDDALLANDSLLTESSLDTNNSEESGDNLLLGTETSVPDDGLLMTDDTLPTDAKGASALLGGHTPQAENTSQSPPAEPERSERRAALGGWYLEPLALRYRPLGHADPVLRGWLELLDRAPEPSTALLDPKGPGACAKCHLAADGSLSWQNSFDSASTSPTVFNHHPHIGSQNLQGCNLCHTLRQDSGDQSPASSGLLPVSGETCAECHRPNGASEHCSSCHLYHAGEPAVARQKLPLKP